MTTFQDPPLQSRRTVRQNERDQSPAAVVPTTGPTPTPVAPAAPAEPLTYATQTRTPVPEYDGPSFRSRRTPDPVTDAATDAAPQPGQPEQDGVYRPRDYSPEGRRSAAPNWAPAYAGVAGSAEAPIQQSPFDPDEPVEHTLTRRELRALRDAHGITAATTGETVYPTPEPEASPAQAEVAAPAAAAPVAEAPVAPAPVATGTPLAAPSTRLDSALAEFDQLAAGRPAAVPTDPPAARGRRAAAMTADEAPAAEAPVAEAPAAEAPVAEAPVAESPVIEGPVIEAPVIEVPVADAPVVDTPAEVPALVEPPAPAQAGPARVSPDVLGPIPTPLEPTPAAPQPEPAVIAEIVPEPVVQPEPAAAVPAPVEQIVEATVVEEVILEPSTSTPPTGHWSTQAQLDDETQVAETPLARNIGSTSGAITTSALVLPSIPEHDFGPLGTGDIMVTGSISLPQSLSATGAHPTQLDESDLDHLLDPGDHQVANTDSQPVRAIKAVSTHTSSRGVIQTVKPKGTRGLTALIIAATSMAVIVGALFIVLVATGQL